jgi:hypothetical protein
MTRLEHEPQVGARFEGGVGDSDDELPFLGHETIRENAATGNRGGGMMRAVARCAEEPRHMTRCPAIVPPWPRKDVLESEGCCGRGRMCRISFSFVDVLPCLEGQSFLAAVPWFWPQELCHWAWQQRGARSARTDGGVLFAAFLTFSTSTARRWPRPCKAPVGSLNGPRGLPLQAFRWGPTNR